MKMRNTYTMVMALAGLVMFAFTACIDLTGPGGGAGETIPEGKGLARIHLGGDGKRTVVPDMEGCYFTLDFTAPGKTTVHEILDGGLTLIVTLEAAVWNLEVKGYPNSVNTYILVQGNASISITAGAASSFNVYLIPTFDWVDGNFSYSIGLPATVSRGLFALYPINVPGAPKEIEEIDISLHAGGTAAGTLSDLTRGSYQAVIDLYNEADNKAAVWTTVVQHYAGPSPSLALARTFTAGNFAGCDPVVGSGLTTLAAKLDAALGSPSGAYTIVLEGTETDLLSFTPKTLSVTGNKNTTITIRGNGHEVQLGSNGRLFTLGADPGSSLTLTLRDVTLRGISDNNDSLVRIETGGTLEMKTGSFITGNTFTSPYGGGVYIDGGTFTMSGGAVNYNRASSTSTAYGSGVYVTGNGTFTMSGGAVSSNFAYYPSDPSASSYGGGVYIDSGTFTMSSGAVSRNGASSTTSSSGGGVYVAGNGTFTMSGGGVSGNSASPYFTYNNSSSSSSYYGGGVYVASYGTFTMSGGAVSYNSANPYYSSSSGTSSSYGNGVYVASNGTFTMSGGEVHSNHTPSSGGYSPSSAYGGGVYVAGNGTFTMNKGMVSGSVYASPSYPASAYGGGVYVAGNGTFTMSGGEVRGYASSSSYSYGAAYGGGVYVASNGIFTMNGGEVHHSSTSCSYRPGYGGGVYVAGNGTFIMNGGGVNHNSVEPGGYISASAYGGGVYVAGNGTFTMNNGAVSGNSVFSLPTTGEPDIASSYGGGVYVANYGTFTMSGGEVSGNYAESAALDSFSEPPSSYGGGVYSRGTFTMSSGTVSGNTVHSGTMISSIPTSSYGGGVYIDSGTFTMSGGTVNGNIVYSTYSSSSPSSSYGGGVYVTSNGAFTKTSGIIYGYDAADPDNANWNTCKSVGAIVNTFGHAAYYDLSPGYYRDASLYTGNNIRTTILPAGSGAGNSGTTNWIKK
jgi:hypothetical protein